MCIGMTVKLLESLNKTNNCPTGINKVLQIQIWIKKYNSSSSSNADIIDWFTAASFNDWQAEQVSWSRPEPASRPGPEPVPPRSHILSSSASFKGQFRVFNCFIPGFFHGCTYERICSSAAGTAESDMFVWSLRTVWLKLNVRNVCELIFRWSPSQVEMRGAWEERSHIIWLLVLLVKRNDGGRSKQCSLLLTAPSWC